MNEFKYNDYFKTTTYYFIFLLMKLNIDQKFHYNSFNTLYRKY